MSINDLLKKHNLTHIDYLFIDAEGVDFDILKSLDMQVHIEHIQIEHLHLDKQELYSFMRTSGYRPLETSLDPYGYDTLFKKLSWRNSGRSLRVYFMNPRGTLSSL